MKFFSTAALLALAVAAVSADIAAVRQRVSDIDAAVADLNTRLQSNNIGYLTALGIHGSAQDLDAALQDGTSEVQANTETVTDDVAQEFIATLTGTEANAKSATDRLVELKSKFQSLGVTNLVKQDVAALQASTSAFGAALVDAAPSAEQADAQALADKFNADLQNAATAYA